MRDIKCSKALLDKCVRSGFEIPEPVVNFQQVWEWLYDKKGVFIYTARTFLTDEEPISWVINKRMRFYHYPVKQGIAKNEKAALEKAFNWALENMKIFSNEDE